jgi:hypothetical protein
MSIASLPSPSTGGVQASASYYEDNLRSFIDVM